MPWLSRPVQVVVLIALAGGPTVFDGAVPSSFHSNSVATARRLESLAKPITRQQDECMVGVVPLIDRARALQRNAQYPAAVEVLRGCALATARDHTIDDVWIDALAQQYRDELKGIKLADWRERHRVLTELQKVTSTDGFAPHAKEFAVLEKRARVVPAAEQAKGAAPVKTAQKKRDVVIGLSKDAAIASTSAAPRD